nr:MAG TPA: hypothetical protein [Caudoviricetes sp.]
MSTILIKFFILFWLTNQIYRVIFLLSRKEVLI